MKILHVALLSPFTDGFSYQENLLTKAHLNLGNEVHLITTDLEYKEGKLRRFTGSFEYEENGIKIYRKSTKNRLFKLFGYANIKKELKLIKPDYVFFHGLCSISISQIVSYKKRNNKNMTIVMDTHEDEINSPVKNTIKNKFKFLLYKFLHKRSIKYIHKIFGVTSNRIMYAINNYSLPKEKMELLIMGADDDMINLPEKKNIRKKIRNEYNISDNDFLLVTGGKIDHNKRILELMEAVQNIPNAKLMIFGSVDDEIIDKFKKLAYSTNIIYLGWQDSGSIINFFHAADLVAFPGTHSVLWEQACATKTPCIFRKISGMEHVNNSGSALFFKNEKIEDIREDILDLVFTQTYFELLRKSNSNLTDVFLYSNIAKKSLL